MLKKLFTLLALAFCLTGKAQIITTVAGNGTSGHTGDGGQATAAELNDPYGVAFDAAGNMYIPDRVNNCIRKVSTTGVISTVAGNGTAGYSGDGGQATAAELYVPIGVAFDALGNLYIDDRYNQRIRKVNTAGIISTVAGNGTAAYAGDGGQATAAELNQPFGIAIDASGNLYIADELNNRVRKVNTLGIISTIAGNGTGAYAGDGGQAIAAELNEPSAVALDAVGNLYVADSQNNRIRKVTNVANTIATASPTTICAGGTTTLTASGATTYSWSPATGLSATTGSMVTASPTVTTTYTVVGTTGASTVSTAVTVSVNPLPTITVFIGNNTGTLGINSATICTGTSATLCASGGATPSSYTWSTGVVNDCISETPNVSNNYTVTGIDANGCVNSDVATITLNPLPTLTITASTNTICAGNTSTLTASGALTYTWNAGYVNPSIVVEPTITTNNTVTGTDANGCMNKDTLSIIVDNCTTSISQISGLKSQILIYPNPNNGSFVIEISSATKQTMQMYDVNGKLVLSQIINGKTNVDASSLNEGVYNISLQSNEGVVNKRLVIVR